MTQIKDNARWVPAGESSSHRHVAPNAIDGQISGLLSRRAHLLRQLAEVDKKLAQLRTEAAAQRAADDSAEGARWFSLRGEQVRSRGLVVPGSLDEGDLRRRLEKVLEEEGSAGRPVDGLEMLVAFEPGGGRVLSVQTRRPGEMDWVRRFEAASLGPGH